MALEPYSREGRGTEKVYISIKTENQYNSPEFS